MRAEPEDRKRLSRVRLVAVDLDGTLVHRDGTSSLFTRSMVRKAARSGIHMILATGRTSGSAWRLARWLGLGEPLICSNGAHVVSGIPREDWQFIPIPAGVLPGLIGLLRGMKVPFESHVKGRALVERQFLVWLGRNRRSVRYVMLQMLGARLHSVVRLVDDGTTERLAGQVVKIVLDATPDLVSRVASACESAFPDHLRCVTTFTTHGNALLEIQDASVNKGQALSLVAERLGVSAEESAAVGDGDNDVELLGACGLKVAMANASPRLAMAAERFTFSCDEDGVAHFLKEVLVARSGRRG